MSAGLRASCWRLDPEVEHSASSPGPFLRIPLVAIGFWCVHRCLILTLRDPDFGSCGLTGQWGALQA